MTDEVYAARMPGDDDVLDKRQIMELLEIPSESYVRDLLTEGHLPGWKDDRGRWQAYRRDVLAYLRTSRHFERGRKKKDA